MSKTISLDSHHAVCINTDALLLLQPVDKSDQMTDLFLMVWWSYKTVFSSSPQTRFLQQTQTYKLNTHGPTLTGNV